MRDELDRVPDPDLDDGAPEPDDGEALNRLFHVAGPRPSAPARVVAEVKQATYPAWQAKVRAVARARRRRAWTLAAAAALLIGAGLALWRIAPELSPVATPGRVATVEVVTGAVVAEGSRSDTVTAGTELDAGSTIEAGPGSHATLRLAGGVSARLDAGTRLRLATASALELERGAVYFDTGSATGAALEVTTLYGVARDVGTQFEVRLLEDGLRIQVRDGEVEVDLGKAAHTAEAGTALTVGASGAVTREAVSVHGPPWGWILRTSPPFELEGRTLGEFLDWVAQETGWRTRFADPALERELTDTVVHGSIAGARPDQAPDLVLPGFGLRYLIEDGTLLIEQAGAGRGAI